MTSLRFKLHCVTAIVAVITLIAFAFKKKGSESFSFMESPLGHYEYSNPKNVKYVHRYPHNFLDKV